MSRSPHRSLDPHYWSAAPRIGITWELVRNAASGQPRHVESDTGTSTQGNVCTLRAVPGPGANPFQSLLQREGAGGTGRQEQWAPTWEGSNVPRTGTTEGPQGRAPSASLGGGPHRAGLRVLPLIPTGSLGHSPEALQQGHVAQSLSERGQCGTTQREMAEAGGEEARGGLGITGVHHRCTARPHPVLRPRHSAIPRDLQDSHLHPHGVATLHKTKPHETPKGRLSAQAKATRAAGLCSESHSTWTAGQASHRAQSKLHSRPSPGLGAVLRGGTSCRHFADEV